MCSVSVSVVRSIVVIIEVPAIHVIDKSIAVIINSVVGCLPRIHPNICSKVRMGDVDARVDDPNNNISRSCCNFPCLWCVDVRICRASRLPVIIQSIKSPERWVVWRFLYLDWKIRFNEELLVVVSGPIDNVRGVDSGCLQSEERRANGISMPSGIASKVRQALATSFT